MLIRYFKFILIVTGLITMSTAVAFFLPEQIGSFMHMDVKGEIGIFFTRHWGLEVACIGALLIWAGIDASVRTPILMVAIVGKTGIVYLLLAQNGNPAFAGMTSTIYFDTSCVVLYVLYLLQSRKGTVIS